MAEDSLSALQGLLDPETLKALQGYIAAQSPSESDKHSALTHGLLTAALGTLASRTGNPWTSLGQGGLAGMQGYNQELSDIGKQRSGNTANAMQMVAMARQLQGLGQSQGLSDAASKIFSGTNGATQPGPAQQFQQPGGAAALAAPALGGAAPAPVNLPTQQPAAPTDTAAKYRQLAELYARSGPQYAAQAKQYSDIANQIETQQEYSTSPQVGMNKDNQPVNFLINKRGDIKELNAYAPKPEYKQVDSGQTIGFYDPLTNKSAPGVIQKQQSPESKASNALGYANLAESKRYHNLELGVDGSGEQTNVDAVAKAIAAYQQPGLSSFAMAKPIGAAIMGKVMEYNPTYDAKNYVTAQQTANSFAKGKEGQTTRSLNVAMQHLDVVERAMQDLNNGGMPVFNRVANFIAKETGSPAPGNFNAVKEIVGNEVVKAVVGSGGGVTDRTKAQETINNAQTPAQLAGVVQQYKQLFGGQLSGLETQYKAGTGRDDFKQKFLHADTAKLLQQANTGAAQPKVVDFASLPGGK